MSDDHEWPKFRCWNPADGSDGCDEVEAPDVAAAAEVFAENRDDAATVFAGGFATTVSALGRAVSVRDLATGKLFRVEVAFEIDHRLGRMYSAESCEEVAGE